MSLPAQTPPVANSASRATDLLARYRAVRSASLALTAPLSPEDMMVQSCAEASPAKWHLAHTSWFFETFVLRDFLAGYRDFHPDFLWLFNSYYNSLGDQPAKNLRSSFSRPPLDQILAYRAHVDSGIARLLEAPPEFPANAEAARRIALGLHHEQQHQELIATDIKHALFTNPLHPAYLAAPAAAVGSGSEIAPPLDWVSFTGGLTEIGFAPDPTSADSFCFDNESPRHTVYLQPYSLATRLVTVAEYLAFMDDSGYERPELWLSEGWTAMREQGWQAPLYWQRAQNSTSGWRIYTMHGLRGLDELSETPVCHVSLFEADAYARWASRHTPACRLPTEFEWEHAAAKLATPANESSTPSATARSSRAVSNLIESGTFHPTRSASASGLQQKLQQVWGDVWEWTASAYTGYPGYRPLPGALGEYNGKFMSSQMVLRGGSCVTPATHIRATYRNYFSPGTRWQFSGIRLALDAA